MHVTFFIDQHFARPKISNEIILRINIYDEVNLPLKSEVMRVQVVNRQRHLRSPKSYSLFFEFASFVNSTLQVQ